MTDKQPKNRSTSHSEQRKSGRGQNPASKANLKPFEKGHSGNPSGKPVKNAKFIEALKKYGNEKPLDEFGHALYSANSDNNHGAVVERVWKDATAGNYTAIRLLLELGAIEPNKAPTAVDIKNTDQGRELFTIAVKPKKYGNDESSD